jgi:hypothetical protein
MAVSKIKFSSGPNWEREEDPKEFSRRIYQKCKTPWPSDPVWYHYSCRPWELEAATFLALASGEQKVKESSQYFYHIDQKGHSLVYMDPHVHCSACSGSRCNFKDIFCEFCMHMKPWAKKFMLDRRAKRSKENVKGKVSSQPSSVDVLGSPVKPVVVSGQSPPGDSGATKAKPPTGKEGLSPAEKLDDPSGVSGLSGQSGGGLRHDDEGIVSTPGNKPLLSLGEDEGLVPSVALHKGVSGGRTQVSTSLSLREHSESGRGHYHSDNLVAPLQQGGLLAPHMGSLSDGVSVASTAQNPRYKYRYVHIFDESTGKFRSAIVPISEIENTPDQEAPSPIKPVPSGHFGMEQNTDGRDLRNPNGDSNAVKVSGGNTEQTCDLDYEAEESDQREDVLSMTKARDLESAKISDEAAGSCEDAINMSISHAVVPKKHKKSKKKRKRQSEETEEQEKLSPIELAVLKLSREQSEQKDSIQAIADFVMGRNSSGLPEHVPEPNPDAVNVHALEVSADFPLSDKEDHGSKRKHKKSSGKHKHKKQKTIPKPTDTRAERSSDGEGDEEIPKNFAARKKGLAEYLELVGVERKLKGPNSIAERKLLNFNPDTTEYFLPTSQVIKDNLIKANAAIRDITPEKADTFGRVWTVQELPPVGSKPKLQTTLRRAEVGIKDGRRNHYKTVELPFSAEVGITSGDFSKQVLYSCRRDSLDMLQSQSFAEQAIGAAVTILREDSPSKTNREEAAELLLSTIYSLKSQVALTTRILANSTMACRNISFSQVGLNKEFTESLMTIPIETEQVIPPNILGDMRKLQTKEVSSVDVVSQTLTQILQAKREGYGRGRGRGPAPRNRGNRYPQKTAAPIQQKAAPSHFSTPKPQAVFKGKKFRGKGRNVTKDMKVSTKPAFNPGK